MQLIKYAFTALILVALQNIATAQSAFVSKSDSLRADSIFAAKSDSLWRLIEKQNIAKQQPVKVKPKSGGSKSESKGDSGWGNNKGNPENGNGANPKDNNNGPKGEKPKDPPPPKIVTNPLDGYTESYQLYKFKGQSSQALQLTQQCTAIIQASPSTYIKQNKTLVLKVYKLSILLNYELDKDEEAGKRFNELYKLMGAKTTASKVAINKQLKAIKL